MLLGSLALLLAGLSACRSASQHYADADREVYAILADARKAFTTDPQSFTIDPDRSSLEALVGDDPKVELGPLSLVEVLQIAAANSRDYQERKERLYLSALDLTLERYRFQVQSTASLSALLSGAGDEAQVGSVGGAAGFTRLLGTGARIVGDLGISLVRDLSTGDGFDAVSTLGIALTQPLLRGAGKRIVMEPLTQAERNVVYEVRAFERFRRTFALDVATRYYRALQQGDRVINQQADLARRERLRLEAEALGEAGRRSRVEVDQARQQEMTSRNSLVSAEQNLENLLDALKQFMGLPIHVRLSLDSSELSRLADLTARDFEEEVIVEVALRERLDYQTALDQVDDRRRQVMIAADDLRSALDLGMRGAAVSGEGTPLDIDSEEFIWSLTLDLDLAIDRLPERNVYRRTLIALQDAEREAERLADSIRLALRNDLRSARANRESYQIQVLSTELATSRVQLVQLNLEAGRATTRDLLEAQSDLLSAQNGATGALVDIQLATLALYLDLEALRLEESGLTVDENLKTTLLEMAK